MRSGRLLALEKVTVEADTVVATMPFSGTVFIDFALDAAEAVNTAVGEPAVGDVGAVRVLFCCRFTIHDGCEKGEDGGVRLSPVAR